MEIRKKVQGHGREFSVFGQSKIISRARELTA